MKLKSASLPKPVKLCLLTGVLVLVYLIIAIPFKVMSVIPGFTDIRPVMLFKPVFGIFFGIPGCIAFAIGNLIGDLMSDSLRWSSIAGFAANFLGPFLFYLFRLFSKTPFSLRTFKEILKTIAVIAVSAVAEAIIITPAVTWIYPEVDANYIPQLQDYITSYASGGQYYCWIREQGMSSDEVTKVLDNDNFRRALVYAHR